MVFAEYAPLGHILPQYLAMALQRRLNHKQVETIPNNSLRWVGLSSRTLPELASSQSLRHVVDGTDSAKTTVPTAEPESCGCFPAYSTAEADALARGITPEPKVSASRQRLHVITAHWSDSRDTAMHTTDRVVLAGADVAPLSLTLDLPGKDEPSLDAAATPIAGRKKAGTLEVDAETGAVVVNDELAATSCIWVAGDMAYFPSRAHGGKRLVLHSEDHAFHSGTLAGTNMAVAAMQTMTAGGGGAVGAGRMYRHSPAFIGQAPLAGVRMATVGDCSAAMPSYGFWWTNGATGLTRKTTAASVKRDLTRFPPAEDGERAGGVTLRNRQTARRQFTPVFGTGVVFYTDGAKVKGAMLWGFPGEATTAASMTHGGFDMDRSGVEVMTPADVASGISARALDVLRDVIERSMDIDVDFSDQRAKIAWVQGLSDAAKVVVRETGVGHLQPTRK